jgi:hypothetical protein
MFVVTDDSFFMPGQWLAAASLHLPAAQGVEFVVVLAAVALAGC